MTRTTFAERLRDASLAAGLQPADLAKRIGVSKATIYRWLQSNEAPSIDGRVCIKLSNTLRVSVRYLLLGDGEPALRMSVTPEESALIEGYRRMPDQRRKRLRLCMANLLI